VTTATIREVNGAQAWQGSECIRGIATDLPQLAWCILGKTPINSSNLYKNWSEEDLSSSSTHITAYNHAQKALDDEKSRKSRPGCCEDCGNLKTMEGHLPYGHAKEVYGSR
jgi:hypothetical protein